MEGVTRTLETVLVELAEMTSSHMAHYLTEQISNHFHHLHDLHFLIKSYRFQKLQEPGCACVGSDFKFAEY